MSSVCQLYPSHSIGHWEGVLYINCLFLIKELLNFIQLTCSKLLQDTPSLSMAWVCTWACKRYAIDGASGFWTWRWTWIQRGHSNSHICLVGVLFTIRGESLQGLASITAMICNGCNTVLHLETSVKVREVQQAVRYGSVTLQLFGAKWPQMGATKSWRKHSGWLRTGTTSSARASELW